MDAIINSFLDIGWNPVAANLWISFDDQKWMFDGKLNQQIGKATFPLKCAVADTLTAIHWTSAAEGHCGMGLEVDGPDLTVNRRL